MPLEANAVAHAETQTILLTAEVGTDPDLNLMKKGYEEFFKSQDNLETALREFQFRKKLIKKDDYDQMKKEVLDEIMMAATGDEETDPVEIGEMIREKLLPLAEYENKMVLQQKADEFDQEMAKLDDDIEEIQADSPSVSQQFTPVAQTPVIRSQSSIHENPALDQEILSPILKRSFDAQSIKQEQIMKLYNTGNDLEIISDVESEDSDSSFGEEFAQMKKVGIAKKSKFHLNRSQTANCLNQTVDQLNSTNQKLDLVREAQTPNMVNNKIEPKLSEFSKIEMSPPAKPQKNQSQKSQRSQKSNKGKNKIDPQTMPFPESAKIDTSMLNIRPKNFGARRRGIFLEQNGSSTGSLVSMRRNSNFMIDSMMFEMSKMGALTDRINNLQTDLVNTKHKLKKESTIRKQIQTENSTLKTEIKQFEVKVKDLEELVPKKVSITEIDPEESGEVKSSRPVLKRKNTKSSLKNILKTYSRKPTIKKSSKNARELLSNLTQGKFKNIKNTMNLKKVLKSISIIYQEKIAQINKDKAKGRKISSQKFSEFLYEFYVHRFGFKKIAEKNFCFFVISLKYHSNHFRVNMLARMLGLVKGKHYTETDIKKYFDGLNFLINNERGFDVKSELNNDGKRSMFAYVRADEYCRQYLEPKLSQLEYQDFREEMDKLKQKGDKFGNGKAGIIDSDEFLSRVLEKYQIIVNRAKQHVIDAFKACDIDGDNTCSVDEYIMLNRYIESDKFDLNQCIEDFFENADLEEDGEKNMSFDKFAVVSVEKDLFTKEKQNQFIGLDDDDNIDKKFKELQIMWSLNFKNLTDKLKNFQSLGEDEAEDWQHILDVLDERIRGNSEQPSEDMTSDEKAILIAYKMTEMEFQRIEEEDEDDGDDYDLEALEMSKEEIPEATDSINLRNQTLNNGSFNKLDPLSMRKHQSNILVTEEEFGE